MTTQPNDDDLAGGEHEEPTPLTEARVIAARDLFDGRREILIEHEGECYRLRITRRNRLILQK